MSQRASHKTQIITRRMKALAYLRYGGLDPLYRRLPQSSRTAALALQKGELGPELAQALQQELGAEGWRFIVGEIGTLVDEPARAA